MSSTQSDKDNTIETEGHNVVITGFGLFRDHQLNPSWECIKDEQFSLDPVKVNIVKKQVDVSYEEVDRVVADLWKKYNPLLMVHIGLAAHESAIRIEQVARHGPYIHDDILSYAPHRDLRIYNDTEGSLEERSVRHSYSCKPCEFGCSTTCIDIDRVCERVNKFYKEGKLSLPAKKSTDAGLYVCEYIYQKSLQICDRSVFIHVPDVENFRLEQIRDAVKITIEVLVDEIFNKNTGKNR